MKGEEGAVEEEDELSHLISAEEEEVMNESVERSFSAEL